MAQLLLRSLFFLPQQTPAQPWLTGAIFTARSPGPIHWRLPASGTGSRPRQLEQGHAEKRRRRRTNTKTTKSNAQLLTERQVCLNSCHIRIVHASCFAQPAFALCVFRRQQMTSRRVGSQHLAARRDFKSLCY